jgi:hypothetical protein
MMKTIISLIILTTFVIQGISQENSDFEGNHPGVHKIIAKEVLQTTSYTYVHAEENGELNWIAVPKMAAEVGATYYYQGGMQMGEFKSKELDRTFDNIIFLDGLISPDVVEAGKPSLSVSNQKTEASVINIHEPIEPAEGGVTIAELYANKEKYAGKIVKVRGKVTKYNEQIMSRNWIHIQDAAANQGKMDLTATSSEEFKVGEIVTLQGMITLDKDFGAGYRYDLIMENSRIVEAEK